MEFTVLHISDNQSLQQLAMKWKKCEWLAMDTEFVRCGTFNPQPALIQIYDGEQVVLIDPLSIECWQPLIEVLEARKVVKIMHAASEDLEVFYRLINCIPVSLVDVQVAAAFCGIHYPSSYQRLVNDLLGIRIDKRESRSNWLKRPLTDMQINYAVADVCYLHKLYKILNRKISIDHPEKIQWFLEECKSRAEKARTPEGSWKESSFAFMLMHPGQKAILKALYIWREDYIRENNIPRNKTINGLQLINISRKQPDSMRVLQAMEGLTPRQIRKYGKQILEVIVDAKKRIKNSPVQSVKISSINKKEMRLIGRFVHMECSRICRFYGMHLSLFPGKKYISQLVCSRMETGKFNLSLETGEWKKRLLQPAINLLEKKMVGTSGI